MATPEEKYDATVVATTDESKSVSLALLAQRILHLKSKEEELQRLESDIAKQNLRIVEEHTKGAAKLKKLKEELNETLVCPACPEIMYQPYILPECGHTLCQQCLLSWFGKQKRDFREEPGERRRRRETVNTILNNLRENLHSMENHEINEAVDPSQFARPIYSCPICRHAVPLQPTYNAAVRELAIAVHGPPNLPDADDGKFEQFFQCILEDLQYV